MLGSGHCVPHIQYFKEYVKWKRRVEEVVEEEEEEYVDVDVDEEEVVGDRWLKEVEEGRKEERDGRSYSSRATHE